MAPRAVFIAAFLFASGPAAATAERPAWLSGESPEHPKGLYIIGVGEGPTQEKAGDKARAEIAKAFSLSVAARTRTSARETTDGSASAFSSDVSEDVRVSTVKVLDGVEVARYFRDLDGTHYALAVLDRGHALKILKDKLDGFDAEFKTLSEELAKTEGRFSKLRSALKLVRLARTRRQVNADYRVLSPEGKGVPAPEGLNDALSQARKALRGVTVQVAAQGENSADVATRLVDVLGGYGLKAVERSSAPDILLEAEAEGRPLPAENLLWFWARGRVGVRLSYGATGEVFARFEESGEAPARDPGSAVDKTILALADKAAARAFQAILTTELADD